MKKIVAGVAIFVLMAIVALFTITYIYFPVRHLNTVRANAGALDEALILAVIMAESSFNHNAQSHAGAQGLMQLMPTTAADIARRMGMHDFNPQDVWDPDVNIAMGAFYLNWLYARYNGDITLMLAAYNAGLGNVDRWLANPELSEDGISIDTIPFPETHNYVVRVGQFRHIYRFLLALPGRRAS